MRRPFSIVRDGCGTSAAFCAVAAMVLHLFIAAPMAFLAASLDAPVCSASVVEAGADSSGIPAVPHRHDDCLLCHGSAVPILAMAAMPMPADEAMHPCSPAPVEEAVADATRFDGYAARAPPAPV